MTMKRKPPEERKQITPLSLDPDIVDWLDRESGEGSRSGFVNNILRGTMEVAKQFDHLPDVEEPELNPDTTKKKVKKKVKSKVKAFDLGYEDDVEEEGMAMV